MDRPKSIKCNHNPLADDSSFVPIIQRRWKQGNPEPQKENLVCEICGQKGGLHFKNAERKEK